MRTEAMFILAATSLVGCQSLQDLCRDEVNQTCERQFSCRSDSEKATSSFILHFGNNVEECKTKLYANPLLPFDQTGVACDSADTDAEVCTNWGRSSATNVIFAKANQCRDERAQLSCQDWIAQSSNPALAPAVCSQRCQ